MMLPRCYHDVQLCFKNTIIMQHIVENLHMYHRVYIVVASCWHPVHLIHKQSRHNNVSMYHSVYIMVASCTDNQSTNKMEHFQHDVNMMHPRCGHNATLLAVTVIVIRQF